MIHPVIRDVFRPVISSVLFTTGRRATSWTYVYDGLDYYRKGRVGSNYIISYSSDGGVTYPEEILSLVYSEDLVLINLDKPGGVAGYRQQVRNGALMIDQLIEGGSGDWDTEGTDWENIDVISGSSYWTTRIPSNLTGVSTSNTEIVLTWIRNGISDYDGFKVYISTDGVSYTLKATVGIVENYTASELTAGTLYYFKVVAFKGSLLSPASNVVSVYTLNSALVDGWEFEAMANQDYFSANYSDYAFHSVISPSAVYYNKKTYIAYQGANNDPYIKYYDHVTKTWSLPVQVGTTPLINDAAHGAPAIMIDGEGYLHLYWGAHVTAVQYSKSTNPEDISAWSVQADSFVGTYFQVIKLSNNNIYLFYRKVAWTEGVTDWGYVKTTDNGATWSDYVSVVQHGAYCKFEKGVGDTIHCAINGTDVSGFDRFDLYYLFFDGTVWKDAAGVAKETPVQVATADILVKDSGLNYIPLASCGFDSSNNPFLFFTESTSAADVAVYDYKIAKYEGGVWVVVSVGVAADRFAEYANAIHVQSGGVIDLYLTTGGTADAIGGNIERWRSSDNGDTWAQERVVLIGRLLWSAMVTDGSSIGKVIFSEFNGNGNYYTNKAYLWGETGFIKNDLLPATHTSSVRGTLPLTLYGGAEIVSTGLSFGGASEYALADDNDILSFSGGSPDKPFSITFPIKTDDTATTQKFLVKGEASKREYEVYITANTIVVLLLNAAGTVFLLASCPFTTTGTEVFITVTYDGSGNESGIKIFKDVVESQSVQSHTGTYTGMANGTAKLSLGRYPTPSYYFIGILGKLKLWNKVLSVPEMTLVMNNDPAW